MPPSPGDPLADAIQAFALVLPAELVQNVAAAMDTYSGLPRAQLSAQVLATVAQPNLRGHVRSLLDCWLSTTPEVPARGLALALRAAAGTAEHLRREQTLELVWTGPDSEVIPLRRTDQALLQLINSAQQRLLIVSFAVYKANAIAQALVRAARRGVGVEICLESPNASDGKVAYEMFAALGPAVQRHARLFVWPLDQRPVSPTGHHGSLHAKLAVADGHTLLISSANLTEHAMSLNMEMGMLVSGGEWPARVAQHFQRLITAGQLRAIQ
jgi:phosphatidylserine/phosphatidylglycerophosphate/cardiolipin synthase-like enzyme